jgi:hypothetical protein
VDDYGPRVRRDVPRDHPARISSFSDRSAAS